MEVSEMRPAASAAPANWVLQSHVDWWELVRYGPPDFDAYVRIAFGEDVRSDAVNPPEAAQIDAVRAALAVLASHTTTPNVCYAAIWEGWTSQPLAPQAPRVEIPNRTMLLFTGHVEALRNAPALAWYGSETDGAAPHLAWPEDQAWCLACEVDEELEFTVGCSRDAARSLGRALPGRVREARYGEPAALYRESP